MDPFTLAGFAGVGFIVVAYFANQQGWLNAEDWRFPAANLLGSLLILTSLWTAWNFPWATMTQPIVGPPYNPGHPSDAEIVAVAAGQRVFISNDFAQSWGQNFDIPTGALLGLFCLWLWPEREKCALSTAAWTADRRRLILAIRYLIGDRLS